jgi:hypothetical protein
MGCCHNLLTILVVACFIYFSDWTVDAYANCKKFPYNIIIHETNCRSRNVSLTACQGYCSSWTQPVDMAPHYFEENVNCCKAVNSTYEKVYFDCRGGLKTKLIKKITKCECSKCIRKGKPPLSLQHRQEQNLWAPIMQDLKNTVVRSLAWTYS